MNYLGDANLSSGTRRGEAGGGGRRETSELKGVSHRKGTNGQKCDGYVSEHSRFVRSS